MKYAFFAIAALASFGAVVADDSKDPYGPCPLSQDQANEIVEMYSSIMQNKTYDGTPPSVTVNDIIAEDYHEYSDSILSLIAKNNTLGGTIATATSRTEWYQGVTANPIRSIVNHQILVAGDNKVLWYWTFPYLGISKYPVTGFNLLYIDNNLQVYRADIEFNSIAWGVDIFEIQQYCS